MKLYLTGPMTGLPMHNAVAFDEAAQRLRAIGHDVVNPVELEGRDWSKDWKHYIRRDIPILLGCDGLVALPGWRSSAGSLVEVMMGAFCGIPTYRMDGEFRLVRLLSLPDVPAARETAQIVGALFLGTVAVMGGAWKSGKHYPGEWKTEALASHLLKGSRHALSAYMGRTAAAKTRPDGEPHIAQAGCRIGMAMANVLEGRT